MLKSISLFLAVALLLTSHSSSAVADESGKAFGGPGLSFTSNSVSDLLAQDCRIASSGSEWNTVGFPLTSRFSGRETIPTLPLAGKIRILYIPVDFPNHQDSSNPVSYGKQITKLVSKFYRSMSYGKVDIDFGILPSYVRMPNSAESYGLGTWNQGDYFEFYSQALREAAKMQNISGYDAAVVLGSPKLPTNVFTPGPGFLRSVSTEDGAIGLGAAAGSFQNTDRGFRWMAHEIGHLFGWVDLYDVTGPGALSGNRHEAFGHWDIMSMNWETFSLQINGWFRFQAGWIDDRSLVCISKSSAGSYTVSLSPLASKTGTRMIGVKISDQEVLVIESRKRGSYAPMYGGSNGLLVYKVDGRQSSSKAPISILRKVGMSVDRPLSRAALTVGESVKYGNVSITNAGVSKKLPVVKVVIE